MYYRDQIIEIVSKIEDLHSLKVIYNFIVALLD